MLNLSFTLYFTPISFTIDELAPSFTLVGFPVWVIVFSLSLTSSRLRVCFQAWIPSGHCCLFISFTLVFSRQGSPS